MINSVVVSGRYKGFNDDNKLLLKIDGLENRQIVKIDINKSIRIKLIEYINENDLIGIKGYIELNEISNILIIATKITLLSNNEKAQK